MDQKNGLSLSHAGKDTSHASLSGASLSHASLSGTSLSNASPLYV
ncbi:pentapeptide repeat-containing protein [Persicobacter diffluens]